MSENLTEEDIRRALFGGASSSKHQRIVEAGSPSPIPPIGVHHEALKFRDF